MVDDAMLCHAIIDFPQRPIILKTQQYHIVIALKLKITKHRMRNTHQLALELLD